MFGTWDANNFSLDELSATGTDQDSVVLMKLLWGVFSATWYTYVVQLLLRYDWNRKGVISYVVFSYFWKIPNKVCFFFQLDLLYRRRLSAMNAARAQQKRLNAQNAQNRSLKVSVLCESLFVSLWKRYWGKPIMKMAGCMHQLLQLPLPPPHTSHPFHLHLPPPPPTSSPSYFAPSSWSYTEFFMRISENHPLTSWSSST